MTKKTMEPSEPHGPRPVVAIEFMEVLGRRTAGDDCIFRPFEWMPVIGAKSLMERLADKGWYILIHTCLVGPECMDPIESGQEIALWLSRWSYPWDSVHTTQGKPFAAQYVQTAGDLEHLAKERTYANV